MKVKCNNCGNYVPKEETVWVENIFGKSEAKMVTVCNKCYAPFRHRDDLDYFRELHELQIEQMKEEKRAKKEEKKAQKQECLQEEEKVI